MNTLQRSDPLAVERSYAGTDFTETDTQIVARQLRWFLASEIFRWKPDFIVVHERKGTAVLRAVLESHGDSVKWPWVKVISSAVLDQCDPTKFYNKKILVFDDMLRTGSHLRPVLEQLDALLVSPSDIHIAVFACHEDSTIRDGRFDGCVSFEAFHKHLTSSAYMAVRQQIVALLQQAGSLLLDTEHVELRLRLGGTLQQLLAALQRRAEATVFRSSNNRTNITVYYDNDEAHEIPKATFPVGTRFTSIVKKCRIVQRDRDEFAIIPICLPEIPRSSVSQWRVDAADQRLLGACAQSTEMGMFYSIALLSSLHPLRWVLRDLYAADPDLFTIYLPSRSVSENSDLGYSLEHLRVMYPILDITGLADRLAGILSTAKSEGHLRRKRRVPPRPVAPVSTEELRMRSWRLLQLIGAEIDNKVARRLLTGGSTKHRPGLRMVEILRLGERLGFVASQISALVDMLIDDAYLLTRVDELEDADGVQYLARTFKPDGEVISDLVRSLTVKWGMPRGL